MKRLATVLLVLATVLGGGAVAAAPATAAASCSASGCTYSKNLAGWVGEKGWTKMVSFEEYVRSCVMVYKDGGYVQDCTPEH